MTIRVAGRFQASHRDTLGMVLLGLGVGLVSAQYRLGWDEAAWLAVARKMALGDRLYSEVLENKPPVAYGLVRLLDLAPGPYEAARAVLLGATAFALAYLSYRIAESLGAERRRSFWTGILVATLATLQAGFLLTVEIFALVLMMAAVLMLIRRQAPAAGLLLSVAAMTDLRVPAMLPAIILLAWQLGGWALVRRLAWFTIPIAAFWVVVFAVPDIRFALVDLNLASREGATLDLAFVADTFRSLAPFVVVLLLASGGRILKLGRPYARSAGLLAISGVVMALASRQPYDHYWAFALLSIPLAATLRQPQDEESRRPGTIAVVAVGLIASLLPVILVRSQAVRDQREILNRYEAVARLIEPPLGRSGTFVQFDQRPFLPALLAAEFGARSPVMGFVTVQSERGRREIGLLSKATAGAAMIVDDGVLDVPRTMVSPAYQAVWDMFQSHLETFPCRVDFQGIILRIKGDTCQDLERTRPDLEIEH